MTQFEIKELMDTLGDLFSNWKPTPKLIGEWEGLFGRYDDYAKIRGMISELLQVSTYSTPSMKQFLSIMAQHSDAIIDRTGPVDTKLFIQCVVASEDYPGMAGFFFPVVFASKKPPPEEYWRERAEQLRVGYEDSYGGEWQFIDCAYETNPQLTMCRRRAELYGIE